MLDQLEPSPAGRFRSVSDLRKPSGPLSPHGPRAGSFSASRCSSADGALGWSDMGRATVPVLVALLIEIVVNLRHGDVGLDFVAALSMLAALVFGEYLAAAVVAVMYSGGYLENFAERRAGREMTAAFPRAAQRRRIS